MKIVLTGSLGRISKPLAIALIEKGHDVTVISSQEERGTAIEAIKATPAIGQLYDTSFLAETFKSADVVYLMQPPGIYFDKTPDPRMSWTHLANVYVEAVHDSGVKKIIHLSSIGAHTDTGVGMLAAHHKVESVLKELPPAVNIKFMRPVGFYYNMFAFIPAIKAQGAIIQNYGGDLQEPWVSPLDIAAVIADEIEAPFEGRTVRYIASDEASPNVVAKILGKAIGMPELKWKVVSDEDFLNGLLSNGLNADTAKGLTEMNAARMKNLYDDYNKHKPEAGKVKLEAFAKDFAEVYSRS